MKLLLSRIKSELLRISIKESQANDEEVSENGIGVKPK